MDYVREALAFRGTTAYGLLGAVLMLGVWFNYLSRSAGSNRNAFGIAE